MNYQYYSSKTIKSVNNNEYDVQEKIIKINNGKKNEYNRNYIIDKFGNKKFGNKKSSTGKIFKLLK